MDVILYYESGFPTRLTKHNRLASLIARDGEPQVDGWRLVWTFAADRFSAMWDYYLNDPWKDGRKLVRVTIEPKN